MLLRAYHPEDTDALATLIGDSIAVLGAAAYTPAQLHAWAEAATQRETLRARLAGGMTIVAESAGVLAAFGQLRDGGHLAYLYCAPAFARRGWASAVYRRLESAASAGGERQIETEASLVARPFFLHHGFGLVAVERIERHGQVLERHHLRKLLAVGAAAPRSP